MKASCDNSVCQPLQQPQGCNSHWALNRVLGFALRRFAAGVALKEFDTLAWLVPKPLKGLRCTYFVPDLQGSSLKGLVQRGQQARKGPFSTSMLLWRSKGGCPPFSGAQQGSYSPSSQAAMHMGEKTLECSSSAGQRPLSSSTAKAWLTSSQALATTAGSSRLHET